MILILFLLFIAIWVKDPAFVEAIGLDPRARYFSFREWMAMLLEIVWLVGLFLILPGNRPASLKEMWDSSTKKWGVGGTLFLNTLIWVGVGYLGIILLHPEWDFLVELLGTQVFDTTFPYIDFWRWRDALYIAGGFEVVIFGLSLGIRRINLNK